MKSFRVLVLDDNLIGRGARDLRDQGIHLEVTALERNEIMGQGSIYYIASSRGRQLAQEAANYDAVIIGNNMRTGFVYARMIPDEMKPHTMIVWNDIDAEEQMAYAGLGFEHFGKRHQDESAWLIKQAEASVALSDA